MSASHDPRLEAMVLRAGLPDRVERTPYYMVDLPDRVAAELAKLHRIFVLRWRRDYADADPQFWDTQNRVKVTPAPYLDEFIRELVKSLKVSRHHPGHIHAVEQTKRVIYGCGGCLDDCPRCNFRYVPEGWTRAWRAAVEDHERWYQGLSIVPPTGSDVKKYG